jgi:hypothetical protein
MPGISIHIYVFVSIGELSPSAATHSACGLSLEAAELAVMHDLIPLVPLCLCHLPLTLEP